MATSFLGVDVSKRHIDCYDSVSGRSERIAEEKLEEWSLHVRARPDVLVVFEATGVYGKRLGRRLQENGIAYAEVNPRHVRRFAQACGQLAKNDRIDAGLIARYAGACGVRPSSPASVQTNLRMLVSRREQLMTMIQAEQGHRESCDDAFIAGDIDLHLAALKDRLRLLDEGIRAALNSDSRASILMSMPGVGATVAANLLAHMPELGSLRRGQPAALAGLAPFVRDSGTFRGTRAIYGGRPPIRRALYMAALVASRHNPVCKRRYQHLIQQGKPFKLTITAVMRTMLETLNAMCKNNSPWHE